ncbi:MAG: RNA polymerase sigma factor [Pseudomonadota bacterium]
MRRGPIGFFSGNKDPHRVVREGISECYPRVWRFCIALSGEPSQADDLAQMTCLRALEKAEQFRPGTHLDRWLFTIARTVWLNEMRRNAIRQAESFSGALEETTQSDAPSTETNILAREVFSKVAGLPEAQRVTALLVFVEGYTYAETAEALDIPIGTVMSRISATRKALMKQVEQATGTK